MVKLATLIFRNASEKRGGISMYMTNEGWEQNNQDYLKKSYEKTGFTAEGYAIRKIICGGCGRVFYTTSGSKKYCHSYWCGNRANSRRQREYRQMHRQDLVCQCCGEKFTPKRAGARYCSNACRQKDYRKRVTVNQVLKMSTWLTVTHLPNETQSPPECGNGNSSTCYGKPSGQNEHIVFRNAARSVENQVPPPGT